MFFIYTNKRNKTQKSIIASALLLLEKRALPDITVSDICNGANITRATFYKYYKNIDILYKNIKTQTLNELFGNPYVFFNKHQNILDAQLYLANQVFHYIIHHRYLFKTLMLNDPRFNLDMYNYFKENYINFLSNTIVNNHNLEIDDQFLCTYIASAYTGIIYEWVLSDFEMSPIDLTHSMIFINSNGPISVLEK
ncbi:MULTISPECIES: TetR/AcrR family transcriptional regulator [Staphylococcus]|uniref:TetR/AcrR family transcriptional regulator n=1 Tax=Staphylococcus shinii TaxID=2912228 RepID=A0A418IFU6_9STAP|nr:TetR/AcrR family transcriptional regulator [Staphylococcus shinii]PKI08994.1 TetR/AcrR family transcriptional regulator [Staphylococcus shinii]PKI12329.1 TetR/AcrR family transcriptional regulator [Staphylococcus shinii]PTH96733.1 TetR/AcrR family transcriptional regulator [Staphylococcus shinii]PTI66450.1 TetR/AcrR family transcriptional regulator [Staphylococcus shinii]RIN01124.1 TetR/AcrR family transcriptional regulator [Staphylococcus shinii]